MEFNKHEYSTGELRILLDDLTRDLANSEHFIIKDNWYVMKYGQKVVIFNRVSAQRWKCLVNKLVEVKHAS